jgi:hypothetical protein
VTRKVRVLDAPLAVASDGHLLVNAIQLGRGTGLDAIIAYARAAGLPIFVGVAVPASMRARFGAELDDAAADVVGRLGPRLHRRGR